MTANVSRSRALALVGASAFALAPSAVRAQAPPIRLGTLANGET
jgi:hypothetical protein